MLKLGVTKKLFSFCCGSNQGKEEFWKQASLLQVESFAPRRRMGKDSHFDSREAGGAPELNAMC
jgi:hypothetical protein